MLVQSRPPWMRAGAGHTVSPRVGRYAQPPHAQGPTLSIFVMLNELVTRSRVLLVATAVVLAFSSEVRAQYAPLDTLSTLFVDLVHSTDGTPLEGVVLRVTPGGIGPDQSRDLWTLEKTSAASGRAIFAGLPSGQYTITTHLPRTPDLAFSVTLPPGTGAQVEIPLDPAPAVRLEGVAVEADRFQAELEASGFYRRSQTARGWHYNRTAILGTNPNRTSDFLDWVPKVRLQRPLGGLEIVTDGFRSCHYSIWVDGLLVQSESRAGPPFDIDALDVQDIIGVEVYDKRSEVPHEFRSGRCGALLIWTLTQPSLP